jgi:hypothetical protein
MPSVVPATSGELLKPRREAHGPDLRLVADLGQKERDQGRNKRTRAADATIVLVFIREQRPHGNAQKRYSEYPSHPRAAEQAAEQRPGQACRRMVCDGSEEDSENDRHRALKSRREHRLARFRSLSHLTIEVQSR